MIEFTRISTSDQALQALGAQLAKASRAPAIFFLNGPLGAGKTTLVRGFLRALNYSGKVKSPTYALVEPYEIDSHCIYHFDLYRLNNPKELSSMGIEEYFSSQAICLIEWPANGVGFLPEPDVECYIEIKDEERLLTFKAKTVKGESILNQLMD